LIEQGHLEPQREQVELRKLQSMIDYCFCSTCLRKYMLAYFGEYSGVGIKTGIGMGGMKVIKSRDGGGRR